jgi:hypothetical protein
MPEDTQTPEAVETVPEAETVVGASEGEAEADPEAAKIADPETVGDSPATEPAAAE